jgi:hypothetical protein
VLTKIGWLAVVALGVTFAGCANDPLPPSSLATNATNTTNTTSADTTPDQLSSASPSSSEVPGTRDLADATEIAIPADGPVQVLDRRLLGTNLPAWVGPERLADPAFQRATVESGTTLLRMPGGSWSNAYDWHGCEIGDNSTCFWTWAAKPSDFASFLRATGIAGMWTVSINQTPQSAAAVVAYFNGDVKDETSIGFDRDGVDWQSVGTWAQLRADHGNPDPVGVVLWEVGNEVYGARPEAGGADCASFGWEDVWTCDGTEYVLGDGEHEGYLAFRDAMLAVDPSIEVGAVGVGDPAGWSDFGNEVIAAAGSDLDFYVVHQYGFDQSPDPVDALHRPQAMWPGILDAVQTALVGDAVVAVTEYNLVSFEAGDTSQSMTRAVNALFLADTIGQLAEGGATIANQWNLVNGVTSSGTDYGMINNDDGSLYPQYQAMRIWGQVGTSLLGVEARSGLGDLRVYPTRHDDGRLSIVVINLASEPVDRSFTLTGAGQGASVSMSGVHTDDLLATSMIDSETTPIEFVAGRFDALFPAWSINLIEVAPNG